MLLLIDGLREETTNNGSSTALTRPSDQTTGRTTPWKSNPMVDHPTSEPLQPSTQDGGNCSELKVHSLSMREERSSMFQVALMLKTEISSFGTSMERSTSNGMSSTLMNTQRNQRRENSTRSSDSMLKDHSTLSHNLDQTDTLT